MNCYWITQWGSSQHQIFWNLTSAADSHWRNSQRVYQSGIKPCRPEMKWHTRKHMKVLSQCYILITPTEASMEPSFPDWQLSFTGARSMSKGFDKFYEYSEQSQVWCGLLQVQGKKKAQGQITSEGRTTQVSEAEPFDSNWKLSFAQTEKRWYCCDTLITVDYPIHILHVKGHRDDKAPYKTLPLHAHFFFYLIMFEQIWVEYSSHAPHLAQALRRLQNRTISWPHFLSMPPAGLE